MFNFNDMTDVELMSLWLALNVNSVEAAKTTSSPAQKEFVMGQRGTRYAQWRLVDKEREHRGIHQRKLTRRVEHTISIITGKEV